VGAGPWDLCTTTKAASGGHLEVLRWAREHGCPWNEGTCSSAADGGHLEVLRWAREHHCPWGTNTCFFAAAQGHLEVLRWARAHGCPWHKRRCHSVSWRHSETHAWGACATIMGRMPHIITHNIPTPMRRRQMSRWRATRCRHQEVQRRAREHWCPRPNDSPACAPAEQRNATAESDVQHRVQPWAWQTSPFKYII